MLLLNSNTNGNSQILSSTSGVAIPKTRLFVLCSGAFISIIILNTTLIVGVRIQSENSINIKSCTINDIAIVFEVDVCGEVRIRINGIELDSLMRIKPPVKLR